MSKKVLVIGESCTDVFCYGNCERLCPDAPAPILNPTRTVQNPGMAMNVVRNIESLGVSCDIITNDNWEESTKTRYIDSRTNHMFLRIDLRDKVENKFDQEKFKSADLSEYSAIIVSDYCKGFLTEDDIRQISLSHESVFLDTKKLLGKWCNDLKYIKINSYEYERTKHLITEVLDSKLIVTLGSKGSKYNERTYPVDHVEIKDSSGAGDTYIAALVSEYVKTSSIEKAIQFANACATKVVQKRGVSIV